MGALANGEKRRGRPWGQTLSQHGLYGPDHQHFFVARMDMAVDGTANRVVELELEPAGRVGDTHDEYARQQRRGNAFRRRRTALLSELQAARRADAAKGRHWLVENATGRKNSVGEPTAWKLEPGAGSSIALACSDEAAFMTRAGFLKNNLWVTPFRPEERFPGGDFPNQRPPSSPDGLAAWTAADRCSCGG